MTKLSSIVLATLPFVTGAICRPSDPGSNSNSNSDCHCLPGDSCWPSVQEWDALNNTVDGRLIKTVPIGNPCHDPNYDADACASLQSQWELPQLHMSSSSSVMQPFWANQSCDPFTDRSTPCLIGNYVNMAVNVANADQVAATVKFAADNNIRLVIRNTGHDYHGRSTGAGSLAVWTHNMNQAEVVDWSDDNYTGRALKVGAGIVGAQAAEVANANDLVIVSGECPTVGVAGGFSQGGGHSALSTSFGLGADQTLEFEVVTASGDIVKASSRENSDLYWALSGGGAGNYGVVTSLTIRAYPASLTGGASVMFASTGVFEDVYYEAVARFHDLLPAMIDLGTTVVYVLAKPYFAIQPVTILNSTGDYVRDVVLAPFLSVLKDLKIPAKVEFSTLSYRDHYNKYMGPLPNGHLNVSEYQFGGRLVPRKIVASKDDNMKLQAVLRNVTLAGVSIAGSTGNFKAPKGVNNAVLPTWRDAIASMQLITPWDSNPAKWDNMKALQKTMTNDIIPQLTKVTPGGAAYMNEGDTFQPDWKEVFYGPNYQRLLDIKNKWDPKSFFYGLKNVGSDTWSVAADGRMCRADRPGPRGPPPPPPGAGPKRY